MEAAGMALENFSMAFWWIGRPEHGLLLLTREMEVALSRLFPAAWPLANLSMVCNCAYRGLWLFSAISLRWPELAIVIVFLLFVLLVGSAARWRNSRDKSAPNQS